MPILRSLILKEWFRFFLGAFIILVLLITVAELISGFLRSNVTPVEVILNHLLEIPDKFKLIMPVGCLVASLFSINKLKNRNELTAIFASGYSRKRFMTDIAIGACTIAIIQFGISSFLEPYAKSKKDLLIKNGQSKFKNLKSKGLMASTIGSGKMWFKNDRYFFNFSTFDKQKNQLNDVNIFYYNKDGLLDKRVVLESAKFVGGAWVGLNANIISNLTNSTFPELSFLKNLNIDIEEMPKDFKDIEADITTLNVFSLYKYISKLNEGGINVNEYMVMLLEKFSIALVCIVFGLVAAIGSFQPNRRGNSFGKNLVFVFILVIFYWLINSYFVELGKSSNLNPFIACFIVPVIFSLYLIHYFIKNKQLK